MEISDILDLMINDENFVIHIKSQAELDTFKLECDKRKIKRQSHKYHEYVDAFGKHESIAFKLYELDSTKHKKISNAIAAGETILTTDTSKSDIDKLIFWSKVKLAN